MMSFIVPSITSTLNKFGAEGSPALENLNEGIENLSAGFGIAASIPGAAGAVVGSMVGLSGIINQALQFSPKQALKKLTKEAEKSKEAFTKLSNSLSQYVSTFDELAKLSEDSKATVNSLVKTTRKTRCLNPRRSC